MDKLKRDNNKNVLYLEKLNKKKRRSKKDPNGRFFICDLCSKGYLSKLALMNHIKCKHKNNINNINENKNIKNKKRGRPKKLINIYLNNNSESFSFDDENNLFNEKYLENNNNNNNIDNILNNNKIDKNNIIKIIEEIFKENNNNLFIKYNNNLNNYSFFNKILLYNNNNDNNNNNENNNKTCDNIFIEYLFYIKNFYNEKFFKLILKIIILFRECINKYKNIEIENKNFLFNNNNNNNNNCINNNNNNNEFTEIYDGEQIPEICNEFLTEFLPNYDEYFGINNYNNKNNENYNKIKKLVENFCFWLYDNNYTSSKLINNNNNNNNLITNININNILNKNK